MTNPAAQNAAVPGSRNTARYVLSISPTRPRESASAPLAALGCIRGSARAFGAAASRRRGSSRKRSSLEPETVELLRIALPVGLHGNVQVEVDAVADQLLDLTPCPDADLLQPRPSRPDHDALLARTFQVQRGVHGPRLDLIDGDGDRVGQLVAYPVQCRLTDQLRDAHLDVLVGRDVVRVQRRTLGQARHQ